MELSGNRHNRASTEAKATTFRDCPLTAVRESILETINRKHRRAAAKPAACADSLPGPNLACNSGPVVYAYRLNFI